MTSSHRTRRSPLIALAALVWGLGLANACSTEENANPPVLWLDLDGSEIKVRLVEHEPVPF